MQYATLPFPTLASEIKARALDAESNRDTAAMACSAIRTVDEVAWQAPILASRLLPWAAHAVKRANAAAAAAASSASIAVELFTKASISCEGFDLLMEEANIATYAAQNAENYATDAQCILDKIKQDNLGRCNDDISITEQTEFLMPVTTTSNENSIVSSEAKLTTEVVWS